MEYMMAALIMTSVTLAVFVAAIVVPARPRAVQRRLTEIDAQRDRLTPLRRERHQKRREQIEAMANLLGGRLTEGGDVSELRVLLTRAGYRGPNAVALFVGARALLGIGLGAAVFLGASMLGMGARGLVLALAFGAVGWVLPKFHLGRKQKARSRKIQLSLPDMLDMMVVCVEAGLGLNQAMTRVAEEMGSLCPELSEELHLVNLEIRTGTARDEALRNLAERTGSEDLRSLASTLIQTDRFGTSIARTLRVHSDDLRTKRRQRAEEQAAKTTIKLVFPLVFFIFPAMFVVILAPAMIHISRTVLNLA